MAKVLRVGNLGDVIDVVRLKEIFSEIGNVVHIRLAESQYSGLSRGFGFIEMESDQEAANCIQTLHGTEHSGRVLTVAEAPKEKSNTRAKGRSK